MLRYGTVVKIVAVEVPTPGLMTIRVQGLHRIHINSFQKEADGLIQTSSYEAEKPCCALRIGAGYTIGKRSESTRNSINKINP